MVSICVDDPTPLFSFVSFVTIFGVAKILPYKQREVLRWATKIERYMGKSNAQEYGKRNSGEGEVLVRIMPTRIIAEKMSRLRIEGVNRSSSSIKPDCNLVSLMFL